MRRTVFTPASLERMISMAQAGHTCDEIAAALGQHRATIYSRLLSLGVPVKQVTKRLWTTSETDTAVAMRARGCTFVEIGKALGRSAAATREKLVDADLYEPEYSNITVDPRPSPELLAARDHMYAMEARRDMCASLMGDPPPGFSALDRKRANGLPVPQDTRI